jgi:hypothetical protein
MFDFSFQKALWKKFAGGMLACSDMFLAEPSNETYIDRKLF